MENKNESMRETARLILSMPKDDLDRLADYCREKMQGVELPLSESIATDSSDLLYELGTLQF